MKKILGFVLIILCCQSTLNAQIVTIDKDKVTDFFQNQQFDEAITYLLPAESIDSNNIRLLSYLGYAYYMDDNPILADKYYHAIFMIDSTNVPALQYLALLNKNDSTDVAVAYTRRLINLQPDKAVHYRTMAELFRKLYKKDSVFYITRWPINWQLKIIEML